MLEILTDVQIEGKAETSGVTLKKVKTKALLAMFASRIED